jgi:DNA modification methylase
MNWEILEGDCREVLASLPERSVQTVVTSPPYFGLRDYGTGEWEGGENGCDHIEKASARNDLGPDDLARRAAAFATGTGSGSQVSAVQFKHECGKCGARRVDCQIGLEPSPDEYVAALVSVFREVRRVLRDDGTVWLNLGDSYATTHHGKHNGSASEAFNDPGDAWRENVVHKRREKSIPSGCKPKDLIGVPWMVAFALRADGWYLRSDIIWSKPNPMPESVTDRPTKAHEYLFLLSKGPRYFYDADAIRESNEAHGASDNGYRRHWNERPNNGATGTTGSYRMGSVEAGRNRRSVWTVATQPFLGAHFATFPPKLIEPCILAGSSPKACGVCGAPWRRVVERGFDEETAEAIRSRSVRAGSKAAANEARRDGDLQSLRGDEFNRLRRIETVGWEPSCQHRCSECRGAGYYTTRWSKQDRPCGCCGGSGDDDTGRSVVLDPFAGAGTTGVVSRMHDRRFIGIELNPAYAEMARERIRIAEPQGWQEALDMGL